MRTATTSLHLIAGTVPIQQTYRMLSATYMFELHLSDVYHSFTVHTNREAVQKGALPSQLISHSVNNSLYGGAITTHQPQRE